MRIARSLGAVKARPSCVTFGVFDGVHAGHRGLLGRTAELARLHGLRSVAMTFEPMPEVVLRGVQVPLLTINAEKAELIRALGIDLLVIARFDREFAAMTPAAFMEQVLVRRFGARIVVAGPRTRFGHRAAGDVGMLQRAGPRLGLRVEAVAAVSRAGCQVSSTEIRGLLAEGRVGRMARLLGRHYALGGRVVSGRGIGRRIGYPTANLKIDARKALPREGVYAAAAVVGEKRLPAAVNIGVNPTFAGGGAARRTIEAHVLCRVGGLSGKVMRLELLRRLRGERRFASVALLQEQIARDCERALACFGQAYPGEA